jgi:hypothetical protein
MNSKRKTKRKKCLSLCEQEKQVKNCFVLEKAPRMTPKCPKYPHIFSKLSKHHSKMKSSLLLIKKKQTDNMPIKINSSLTQSPSVPVLVSKRNGLGEEKKLLTSENLEKLEEAKYGISTKDNTLGTQNDGQIVSVSPSMSGNNFGERMKNKFQRLSIDTVSIADSASSVGDTGYGITLPRNAPQIERRICAYLQRHNINMARISETLHYRTMHQRVNSLSIQKASRLNSRRSSTLIINRKSKFHTLHHPSVPFISQFHNNLQ